MNSSLQQPGVIVALRRYNWVCLVLATLLLYNPFFTTLRSGHNLDLCHPVSHRATVGSSELQHFSPADGWDHFPAVNCAEATIVLPLPVVRAQFLLVPPSVPHFSEQFVGPGLWFRPPPAS
ncbi:MAG TPA: hypothetical protein VGR55_03855 [Candidatus Acidoferrum sp.]|nr:hypothetical protein [Candidatus Acidoferrum sp.]